MIDLWPYAAAFFGGIIAIVAAYMKGARDRDAKHDAQREAARRETEERIDDALEADADARRRGEHWVDRLRRAGQ